MTYCVHDNEAHAPRRRDPVQLVVDIMTGQVPDAVDDGNDAGAAADGP